jgi:hypothetical protein
MHIRSNGNIGKGICIECGGEFEKTSYAQLTCGPPKICSFLHMCRHRGSKSVLVPSLNRTSCGLLKDVRIFLETPDIHECADCLNVEKKGKGMTTNRKEKKICLRCNKKFSSDGDYNRICNACSTINEHMQKNQYSVTFGK